MILFFQRWDSGPFLKTLEFLSYPSPANTAILPYFYKHWNSQLILPNTGILLLFIHIGFVIRSFQILEFSSHPFKRWNSSPIFINTLILTLSYQRFKFLFYPSTENIGILTLSFEKIGILSPFLYTKEFKSFLSKRWNSGVIFINTGILMLSLQAMEFCPYFYKHWKYGLISPNILILALFL